MVRYNRKRTRPYIMRYRIIALLLACLLVYTPGPTQAKVDLFLVLDGCPAWQAGARDAAGFWEHARATWMPEELDQLLKIDWEQTRTRWVETTWPDGHCDVRVIVSGATDEKQEVKIGHWNKRDASGLEENMDAAAASEVPKDPLSAIETELRKRWVEYTTGSALGKRSVESLPAPVPYFLLSKDEKIRISGRLDKPSAQGRDPSRRKRGVAENPFDPALWEPSFRPKEAKMAVFATTEDDGATERAPRPEELIRMQTTTGYNKDMMSPPYNDGQYRYPTAYGSCLDDNGVNGVSAPLYVIDVGMDVHHIEFKDNVGNSRAQVIANYYPSEPVDGNFHATATAATAAGVTLGTCPGARVFNLKALSNKGSGYFADIVASVYTCRQHAIANGFKASVINLSLGGPDSSATDAQAFIDAFAAFRSDAHGEVAVAAGNSNANACGFLPAGVTLQGTANAIVVGASDQNFLIAPFSNWGGCVTMFAPGVSVPVAVPCPTHDCYFVSSGTSFSCPSVAGEMLLHLRTYPANWTGTTLAVQGAGPSMTVQTVNYASMARAYTLETASKELIMGMPPQAYNGGNVFPVITTETYMNVSLVAYLVTPAALADPNVVVIPDPPSANTIGQVAGAAGPLQSFGMIEGLLFAILSVVGSRLVAGW